MEAIIPVLFMLIYLGIIIFMISLAVRLVRAVERIADKFENIRPPI